MVLAVAPFLRYRKRRSPHRKIRHLHHGSNPLCRVYLNRHPRLNHPSQISGGPQAVILVLCTPIFFQFKNYDLNIEGRWQGRRVQTNRDGDRQGGQGFNIQSSDIVNNLSSHHSSVTQIFLIGPRFLLRIYTVHIVYKIEAP